MKNTKVDTRLDELYATLPKLACQGLCTEACGPLVMERNEFRRLTEANNGQKPYFDEFKSRCSLLVDGRCAFYEIRPAICRLWGLIKDELECPHGCVPERWMTQDEGKRFLDKLRKVAGRKGQETTLSEERFRDRYNMPAPGGRHRS